MGCNGSKPPPAQEETKERKPLTFGKDPELMKRRHEFIVKNQHDQTIVREPGKIAGQQFIIGDCTGCNIYLFDHIGTITIDMCKNCRIFIGPCASSAFIRDCKNCEIIAAVQQLRTRDCSSIRMLLYSQTAPIVESSHGMSFGCFNFGYEKLQEHFDAAELSVYGNKWAEVYDFTASSGGNFKIMSLEEEAAAAGMLNIPSDIASRCGVTAKCPVPKTLSTKRRAPGGESFFMAFGPGNQGALAALFDHLSKVASVTLVRSREFALDKAQVKRLWKLCGGKSAPAAPASCVGLEFVGHGAANVVNGVVSSLPSAPSSAPLTAEGDTATAAIRFFFVETEEQTGHRLG